MYKRKPETIEVWQFTHEAEPKDIPDFIHEGVMNGRICLNRNAEGRLMYALIHEGGSHEYVSNDAWIVKSSLVGYAKYSNQAFQAKFEKVE